jgi:GDP-L-fucose synthase
MNKDSKVLVTGASGFLGRHVCEELRSRGYLNIIQCANSHTTIPYYIDSRTKVHHCDLRQKNSCNTLISHNTPDVVIHLAAVVGGIGANQENPAIFIHDNLVIGINLIEACKRDVEKFVLVGTVCSYPKYARVPFEEYAIWDGYPEETNAPYGIAKKTLTVMLDAYRSQYGLKGITAIPVNMYGPYDNFKPESSHVIPALIKKIDEAGEHGDLEIWGTGNASREFLHVRDSARGIVMASESYNDSSPVNIGTHDEIKICDLVETLREIMGHKGEVRYNRDKPDGQPRRCLSVTKAKKSFGFSAEIKLKSGLTETVEWYLGNKKVLRSI